MTENEEYIFSRILISIKSGFELLEDVIESEIEAVEEEGWQHEISGEWVRKIATREYEKNIAESKTWQHPTDTERLHAAFDDLTRQGIVAVHNAGYTQSDAIYDVGEVWTDAEDAGAKPIGYCYYHGQDLERAIEEGVLLIGFYGAKENNDKEAIIIGHKVCESLKNAGLEVEWKVSGKTRIELQNFNWQNTYTSDDDVEEKWGYDRVVELMPKE